MTLETLQNVGSEFAAVSILFQVPDSRVLVHHTVHHHVAERGKSHGFLARGKWSEPASGRSLHFCKQRQEAVTDLVLI